MLHGPASVRNHAQRTRREENAPGPIWVDTECIDCDTCRWMAPTVFVSKGGASAVTCQPTKNSQPRAAALQALMSCPTFSIHVDDADPGELATARSSFPIPVHGTKNVYHLGHHDESSYGAAPYLIRRPSGNVMIDVPRWSPSLAQILKTEYGGVEYIFLTHRDDVGQHARWAEALGGAQRIIHEYEANSSQGTDMVERKLSGQGPWAIDEETDVQILFTPGHTKGCISLLYRPDKVLFTGDHLAWSARLQRLTTFPRVNWYSHSLQIESVSSLIGLEFLHVLPGHGRQASFPDGASRDGALKETIERERDAGQR